MASLLVVARSQLGETVTKSQTICDSVDPIYSLLAISENKAADSSKSCFLYF